MIAISASFLANASKLEELHIGNHILSIDACAMAGFDGVIFCDADSAAWAWAQQQSAEYDVHEYTLTFEVPAWANLPSAGAPVCRASVSRRALRWMRKRRISATRR